MPGAARAGGTDSATGTGPDFFRFFFGGGTLLSCFQHLRFRKHDLAVFHLLDRAELKFDFTQPTRFVDLENQSALLAEPEMIRARYFEELNRYLDN